MKKQLQTIAKKAGLLSALIGVSSMYAQTTYTFTSAGATGPNGPTAPNIAAAYLATNLNGSVTVTSGIQTFTIPISGPYRVTAIGAQGAYNGGSPASVAGTFTFTAGTVLKILVGQIGTSAANSAPYYGGGGGGGSFVTSASNVPYIVAGGGGGNGDGYDGFGVPCCLNGMEATITTSANGYPAGGTNGGTGGNGGICGGGSSAGAGAGFYGDGSVCNSGTSATSFTNGGVGGTGNSSTGDGGFGGGAGCYNSGTGQRGGGGGGYSGGGGGVANSGYDKAGGGGGSYNIGASQINSIVSSIGSGQVLITSLYSLNISQTATISCNGNAAATLSATVNGGTAPYTYTWVPTGGNAPTASALAAGVYTCLVQDAGATLTANTFTVTQPAVLVIGVSSLTNVTCNKGNNGILTVTVTGGTTPYSYTWSPTGGSSASATGLVANNYTCVVRDANSCPVVSASAKISEPVGIIVFSDKSLICAGESVNLSAFGATSYTWNTAATTSVIAVSPSVTTTYSVSGTIGVCTYSGSVTQNVSACASTGINEVTSSLISVYPNPNNGIVNISLTAELAQNATLEIYDVLGKLVVKQVLSNELNAINISNLNNGIYTFKVLNNTNTVKIGKLIKQ